LYVRAQHKSMLVTSIVNTVEPGYSDSGVCDTSRIAPDVLWDRSIRRS
jgi:hypothetical protein